MAAALLNASSSSGLATMVSASQTSLKYSAIPPSPSALSFSSSHSGSVRSASSSKYSLDQEDEENMTITASRSLQRNGAGASIPNPRLSEDSEDLRWLATSSLMTELTYTISDVQTRIFEIQELRHKAQSSGDDSGTTTIIDESLMRLDERLESLSNGMKSVNEALEPLLQTAPTPTPGASSQTTVMLRKHAALVGDWEAVQEESNVLREELKEDKWLTVFRTVTDQADGMMSSLEKAVNRCQDFIRQVQRREDLLPPSQSLSSLSATGPDKTSPSIDVFNSLLDSFQAKKKHYMPATSKVLSIIDKGVQDRVTKNGETLRRHAESAQRWKVLRERITKTDADMEVARKILLGLDIAPSENGSSTSGKSSQRGVKPTTSNASRSRAPSTVSSITRSISPFRKFARRFAGTPNPSKPEPVTPLTINKNSSSSLRGAPHSEPIRNKRSSFLQAFRPSQPTTPTTPERPSHKYSYSLTPDSSPRARAESKSRSTTPSNGLTIRKPNWNASTKVEAADQTVKASSGSKRPPSAAGIYGSSDHSPYKRSASRTSMASSRPWSPVSSSVSTSVSSHPPMPSFRPPSRARTPSHFAPLATATTPRPRPKTPSHIPVPQKTPSNFDDQEGGSYFRSMSRASTTNDWSPTGGPARPPSRSMIPVPSLKFSSASRPSSAMSQYQDPSFRSAAARAQTPEFAMRAKVQQIPFYQAGGPVTPSPRLGTRSFLQNGKLPPSSFRDSPSSRTPSRPGSRTGAYTPSMDQYPVHEYIVRNEKDPLDVEMAYICNSIAHGLLVERVDPPLKTPPKAGEEIMAQYAFSNSLARKVVTCRLTTLSRLSKSGGPTVSKKVMCRVGGGWQDLHMYLLNRQAGL